MAAERPPSGSRRRRGVLAVVAACCNGALALRAPRAAVAPPRRGARCGAAAVGGDDVWPTWSASVDPDADMLYMPFLEAQLAAMAKLGAAEAEAGDALPRRLAFAAKAGGKSDGVKARVGSRVYAIDGLFRRVRMTYFDGGASLQVFNSLWYPEADRVGAPLLGVDLLKFGAGKYLCVIDAQPPGGRGEDGAVPHDATALDAIRSLPENAPLRGEVSSKWYDSNRFFSKQMLYGRFDNATGPASVKDVLFPAFTAYLDAYVDAVAKCPTDAGAAPAALAAQADYDAFNAERDPAHGLFTSYFGAEWANDYVHDFLFKLAPPPPPDAQGE